MPNEVKSGESAGGTTTPDPVAEKLKALGFASVDDVLADREKLRKSVEEGTKLIGRQGDELGKLRKEVEGVNKGGTTTPEPKDDAKELDTVKGSLDEAQQKSVDDAINQLAPADAEAVLANPSLQLQFIRDVANVQPGTQRRSLFGKKEASPSDPAAVRARWAKQLKLTINESRQPSPVIRGGAPSARPQSTQTETPVSQRVAGGNVLDAVPKQKT